MLRALLASAVLGSTLLAQVCAETDLWSMRPLPLSPSTITSARIDALVDTRLAEASIARAARADRRTLLRRAALMLTGLPPTYADVEAFCQDPADDAFARCIDRLLASPESAEHLARRWLDLARYSDSNGLDENLAFANAWRYRDWVVQAMHADLPYDRFGTMQLAGDLLPGTDASPRADRIVATGFLALGPRMLAEQDKEKLVLDTVDEQVDLVGRTFLGLTLGCARCHDHKFDPVPTRDYYALAGIFKSTKSFAELGHVSQWMEVPLASPSEIAVREQVLKAQAAAEGALAEFDRGVAGELSEETAAQIGAYLVAGAALCDASVVREAASADATNLGRDDRHWGAEDCVVLHTKSAGEQHASYEFSCTGGTYSAQLRYAAEESRPLRVEVDGVLAIERCAEATTGGWRPEHQRWHELGTVELTPGRHTLRLSALGPNVPHLSRLLLQPRTFRTTSLAPAAIRNAAFLVAEADGPIGRAFVSAASTEARVQIASEWQARLSPFAHFANAVEPPPADETERLYRRLLFSWGGLFLLDAEMRSQLLPEARRVVRERLAAALEAVRAALPPEPPLALAVVDGDPVDLPIHLRGSHLTLAVDKTPRGVLSVMTSQIGAPSIQNGSGRLALARWLFAKGNPMTPRVAANRAWQTAFGEGLARSESNFGMRGELPTHPELLDELAASLVHDGWSVRRLLRTIVLSETWQQSARRDESAETIDPDNRLLWRWSRQRLPAEAVRDSILAVCGTLDRTRGGSLLGVGNRGYVTNDQSGDGARYEAPRRSIYLPVIRNAMYDLFTVFDYADPSVHQEQRPQSTVALQALLLMNSPFVVQQSDAFATAATAAASDEAACITWIWQQALQRLPTESERSAAAQWLQTVTGPARLAGLCQTVLCANEFVFVD
ncbi:MAG: DUF1553 domain-containing protein [Planctomycetota bacterium]